MYSNLQLRRCAILMIEPRGRLDLDLGNLLRGGDALRTVPRWIALAPHLDAEVDVAEDELAPLGRIGDGQWQRFDDLANTESASVLQRLLDKGLLVGDGAEHAEVRSRDQKVRDLHWNPVSAVAHVFSRWRDSDVGDDARVPRDRTLTELVAEYGFPPPHLTERVGVGQRISLPTPRSSALGELAKRRVTCRNFDPDAFLERQPFADLLRYVFGSHAVTELMPGVHALKKSHPSGGSLHPLEAYLLIRRVDGMTSGLYHYHVTDHALEPIALLAPETAADLAERFVAGQDYLADAPVHVALVARFGRTFWKYRNHVKAYRTIVLEAGHVSQNLYLAATEAGLGAFITAAINEVDIERAFGLDPLVESPLAVCGVGARSTTQDTIEFDPLETVWDSNGQRRSAD